MSVEDSGQVQVIGAEDARGRLFFDILPHYGRSCPKDTGLGLALVRKYCTPARGDADPYPTGGAAAASQGDSARSAKLSEGSGRRDPRRIVKPIARPARGQNRSSLQFHRACCQPSRVNHDNR